MTTMADIRPLRGLALTCSQRSTHIALRIASGGRWIGEWLRLAYGANVLTPWDWEDG